MSVIIQMGSFSWNKYNFSNVYLKFKNVIKLKLTKVVGDDKNGTNFFWRNINNL